VAIINNRLTIVCQDDINCQHGVEEVVEVKHGGTTIKEIYSVGGVEFCPVRK
jgi:hypothetical protein